MTRHTCVRQVTTGNGGYDKLEYKEVPSPTLAKGEVLVQVLSAGVNNTEINTRLGWYSKTVTSSTAETAETEKADGGWSEKTPFPLIQGTDCCGRVVSVDDSAAHGNLVGERVLVRPCMHPDGHDSPNNVWMASDFDGAFAQYVKVPGSEVFRVACDWSHEELGTIPCAYGTAENLLHRANLREGESILITGASGGVGSAAVQLAKRRGAIVTVLCGQSKHHLLRGLGASHCLDRADVARALEPLKGTFDVALDIVGGESFDLVLNALKRKGKYITSGAVGGPIVSLDLRTLYLRDLTLIGGTGWEVQL